jgi:hypothetical protein
LLDCHSFGGGRSLTHHQAYRERLNTDLRETAYAANIGDICRMGLHWSAMCQGCAARASGSLFVVLVPERWRRMFGGVVFAISAPVSLHPPVGLLRCLGT